MARVNLAVEPIRAMTCAPSGTFHRRKHASPWLGQVFTMAVYVDYETPVDLAERALEALEVARDTGTVKKGTNETTKAVERGNADLVLVAEDVQPEEIVMHLPELSDEKGIPVVFVETQDDIGMSAGLTVGSAAAGVTDAGDASDDVDDIAEKVEELR